MISLKPTALTMGGALLSADVGVPNRDQSGPVRITAKGDSVLLRLETHRVQHAARAVLK